MGQQQLLLVILVTIIVGIATVVAINTFSSAADGANLDAARQDAASIAASAQGYYMKPAMLGGGGNTFTSMTFEDITFGGTIQDAGTDLVASNANGTYVLSAGAADQITLTIHPSSCTNYVVATGGCGDEALIATIVPDGMNYSN